MTQSNLSNHEVRHQVNLFTDWILSFMEDRKCVLSENLDLEPEPELVVELLQDGRCGYYFVSHRLRLLFWPEAFLFKGLLSAVRGVTKPVQLRECTPE